MTSRDRGLVFPVRLFLAQLSAVSLALFLSNCSEPTWEEVADENLTIMEDLSALIDGIETESDAKKAVHEIEKLTVRFERMKKRYYRLRVPTPETGPWLKEKFEARAAEVYGKIFGADSDRKANFANNPEIVEIITPPMKGFMRVMFDQPEHDSGRQR